MQSRSDIFVQARQGIGCSQMLKSQILTFCLSRSVQSPELQCLLKVKEDLSYEGGSICNENPFITSCTNALGFFAICQTRDQSVAVKMVNEN